MTEAQKGPINPDNVTPEITIADQTENPTPKIMAGGSEDDIPFPQNAFVSQRRKNDSLNRTTLLRALQRSHRRFR